MTETADRPRRRPERTVVYRIEASAGELDRLVGELYGCGTLGLEVRSEGSPSTILAYFEAASAPYAAIRALESVARGVRVSGPELLPPVDWQRRWRLGLAPRRVGGLWLRPSWCEPAGEPELRIDPAQAFGTGEHATTRLALRLLLETLRPGDTLLDVGTGTGILALAALRGGGGRAVGVDCDPEACACARENARQNGLRLALWCGTLDAIDAKAGFDLIVANLLLGELEPWLARLADHTHRGLILSGYLQGERRGLLDRLAGLGLQVVRERTERQSGERWCGCVAVHPCALQ